MHSHLTPFTSARELLQRLLRSDHRRREDRFLAAAANVPDLERRQRWVRDDAADRANALLCAMAWAR